MRRVRLRFGVICSLSALLAATGACRSRGRPPEPPSTEPATAVDNAPPTSPVPPPDAAPATPPPVDAGAARAKRPAGALEGKPSAPVEKPPALADKPSAPPEKPSARAEKPAAPAEKSAAPAEKPSAPLDKQPLAAAQPRPATPESPPPDAGARRDGGAVQAMGEAASPGGSESASSGPSPSDLVAGPRRMRRSRGGAAPPPLPIPGGPLPIPGGKVDLDTARVERFTEEAGTTLDGRLLDADGKQPVAGANIEAWMGTRSIHAQSDGEGRFRFEGLVPKSKITLWITASPTFVQERTEVTVPAEPRLESTFHLLSRSSGSGTREAGVGLFLARRGGRTVVIGLTAFGPAERAGIQTGDTVVSVDKREVTNLGPGAIDYLVRGPMGSEVTLTVRAGSKPPRTFTMKRSGR